MSGPYKFLRSQDLPFILEAYTLVISTPRYFEQQFAAMEVKNPQINDPNEAKVYGHHDYIDFDTRIGPPSDTEMKILRRANIGIPSRASGTFRHNVFISRNPQCFIFSCARGFYPDLKAALTAPPAKYDACVRIRRPRELWREIILSGRWGDRPVREVFAWVEFQPVKYEAISYNLSRDADKYPSPFRKDPAFSNQNEWRAVFAPIKELPEQRIVITLDNLTDFISVHPL